MTRLERGSKIDGRIYRFSNAVRAPYSDFKFGIIIDSDLAGTFDTEITRSRSSEFDRSPIVIAVEDSSVYPYALTHSIDPNLGQYIGDLERSDVYTDRFRDISELKTYRFYQSQVIRSQGTPAKDGSVKIELPYTGGYPGGLPCDGPSDGANYCPQPAPGSGSYPSGDLDLERITTPIGRINIYCEVLKVNP